MISFEQLYNEARHVVDQKIYYHGTSLTHLHNILVNGLNSKSHLSTYEDPAGTYDNPEEIYHNLYPYGGTYLSSVFGVAWRYALDKFDDTGINPVLVVCNISPYSGYLDEDDVVRIFRNLWQDTTRFGLEQNKRLDPIVLKLIPNKHDRDNIIERYFSTFLNKLEPLTKHCDLDFNISLNRDILKNIYLALVYKDTFKFRRNINALTIRLKKFTPQQHALRITDPITFGGRNRIIAIYEGVPGHLTSHIPFKERPHMYQYDLSCKVHYKSPTIQAVLHDKITQELNNSYVWSSQLLA